MARFDKYRMNIKPRFDDIVEYRKAGYSEKSIARYLCVSYPQWLSYKKKHIEFAEILDHGKDSLIEELERCVYKKALGKFKSIKTKQFFDVTPDGERILVREERTEETIVPSDAMLKYALSNLSDKWKDKSSEVEREVCESVYFVDDIGKIPDEELESYQSKGVFDDEDD